MKQLVICIDLEQDDSRSTPEAMRDWHGAHKALEWGHTLRQPGVAINWFVRTDVQTRTVLGDAAWPLRHLYDPLRRALDAGDTVGAHPHLYRQVHGGWRNEFEDPDFAWQCTEVSLEAHGTVFGEPARTWRWGDRGGQPSLRERLAHAGVLVDCTAEPGRAAPPHDDERVGVTSYVGHDTEPCVVDGLVNWPVSTCALASATPAASGHRAQHPVGSFDLLSDQWIHGWCHDATDGHGDTVVDVELLIGGSVVAVTAAEWHRVDLEAAGYGDGRHGVRVAMNDQWRGLPATAFALRAAGQQTALSGPSNDIRTPNGVEVTMLPLPLDTESDQFDRMLAAMMRGGSSHLTLATRSDAFLEPEKSAAVVRNFATLAGHIRAGELSNPRSLLSLAAPMLRS